MFFFLIFVVGVIGGLLGGMGMGGGTLLIPMLTFFFDITQKQAQAINLICFVPMAIIALIIHAKNKLIKLKGMFLLIITALIFSVGASFLLKIVKGDLQSKLFGGFLVILAITRFISLIKSQKN